MRVYGLAYLDTMRLPMRVFWQLSGTVPRLLAGEQKGALEIAAVTQNPEAAVELGRTLDQQAPEPITLTGRAILQMNSVRDEEGFNELKNMAG